MSLRGPRLSVPDSGGLWLHMVHAYKKGISIKLIILQNSSLWESHLLYICGWTFGKELPQPGSAHALFYSPSDSGRIGINGIGRATRFLFPILLLSFRSRSS